MTRYSRLLVLMVVVLVSALWHFWSGIHLDHRHTNLRWTDYRGEPLVVEIYGNDSGPTRYTAVQGRTIRHSFDVSAYYVHRISSVEHLLPELLKESPNGPIIAEMVVSQGDQQWKVLIGKELSPASSRLLEEVGNKMPGIDGPP